MIVSVARGAELLAEGSVVAYPTETVYGLGADPCLPAALERLFEIKGRDPTRAVSVLVAGLAALEEWAPGLPERAQRLARRFWPGPLTLVVRTADPALAAVATAHGVGFRCSPHPTAAALAVAAPHPVVSTSCNRSGEAACGTADEVRAAFGPELPIAGGQPAGGLSPSTVVAVDPAGRTKVLREGAIATAELEAAWGDG